jgi:hypothetical protein
MKRSLEDERRALLEHIEASRAVYRRMLSETTPQAAERHLQYQGRGSRQAEFTSGTRIMHWMKVHPMWVAGGVTLIVLLAPRLTRRGPRAVRQPSLPQPEPLPHGVTLRTLLTVATLLLRDPSRLHTATRMAQSAWQWIRHRQTTEPIADVTTNVTARADRLH